MKRAVGVLSVVAAVLLAAGSAGASTTLVVDGGTTGPPYQRWVDRSKMPTPATTLTVVQGHAGPCGVAVGCTDQATTIWLQGDGGWATRRTLYHELGHVYDALYLTDPQRQVLMDVFGVTRWETRGEHHAIDSGEEQMADAYAECSLWNRHGVKNHGSPTWRITWRACGVLKRAI